MTVTFSTATERKVYTSRLQHSWPFKHGSNLSFQRHLPPTSLRIQSSQPTGHSGSPTCTFASWCFLTVPGNSALAALGKSCSPLQVQGLTSQSPGRRASPLPCTVRALALSLIELTTIHHSEGQSAYPTMLELLGAGAKSFSALHPQLPSQYMTHSTMDRMYSTIADTQLYACNSQMEMPPSSFE